MKFVFTEPFQKDYQRLPPKVQSLLHKTLQFLSTNPRHPSLRARKLPGTAIWYARVSRFYRLTFQYDNEVIILRRLGTHEILSRER